MERAQLLSILERIDKRGNFIPFPFTVGLVSQQIRAQEGRRYLFAINTHATGNLFLGFGYDPTATNGIPVYAHGGFYEPAFIPENDIFAIADTAGTTGVLIVVTF